MALRAAVVSWLGSSVTFGFSLTMTIPGAYSIGGSTVAITDEIGWKGAGCAWVERVASMTKSNITAQSSKLTTAVMPID